MLAIGAFVLVVAVVGAVGLGWLLLGLWRRATGLLQELGDLGDRLDRAWEAVEAVAAPGAQPQGEQPQGERARAPGRNAGQHPARHPAEASPRAVEWSDPAASRHRRP